MDDVPLKSPWVVPPSKAPKKSTSAAILLTGFVILFGGIIYNIYSVLNAQAPPFLFFILCLVVGTVLIMIGGFMFARAVGSAKIAEIRRIQQAYANIKTCPECGRQIPSDAVICPYCGAKLEQ